MRNKIFTLFLATLMCVSMFGMTVKQQIPLDQDSWEWGYNSTITVANDLLTCTLTGEWGAASTGWDPTIDLSEWDKIVVVVDNMSGCDGEWFKLKAYLRDVTESEDNQMEGQLSFDAPDNEQNYLVIDLHQDKACDLTKAYNLAIQCQPNGAVFKISSVYLEKEVEEYVVFKVTLPFYCAPENVEIIGGFDGWAGTSMELLENSLYFVELEAKASQFFKFRSGEGETDSEKWEQQIELYNEEDDTWVKIGDNQLVFGQLWEDGSWKGNTCKLINLDFSNYDKYRWSRACHAYLRVNCDNTKGRVSGGGVYDIESRVAISAIPNYGYHFIQWNDGVTDNPRTIELTQDTTFTAEFGKNPVITYIYDKNEGNVRGATTLPYEATGNVTFEAIPNYGYHFVQWSDGVTDNPRTIELTKDTTFTAEFVQYIYTNVKIGDLYYELNTETKTAEVVREPSSIISVDDNSISDWNNLPSQYVFESACPDNAYFPGLKNIKVYADEKYINYLLVFDPDNMPRHTSNDGLHIYLDADHRDGTGGFSDLFDYPAPGNTDIAFEGSLWDDNGNEVSYDPVVYYWAGETGDEGWFWDVLAWPNQIGASQFVGNNIIEGRLVKERIPWYNWADQFSIGFDIYQNWGVVGVLPQGSSIDGEKIGRAKKLEVTVAPRIQNIANDEVEIPSSVIYNNESYSVTRIGNSAFAECDNIISVTIPNSITSIGYDAFYGCRNITYFEGPLMAYGVIYSERLKTVIITGGETEDLSGYWFGDNIQKLDLAALEIAFIPSNILMGHDQLKELILPTHLERIGCMSLYECLELQKIVIPSLVTEIDKRAFEDCRSLKSVTFEGTALTRIDDWAFYNCHELASINLPEGLTEIGKAAFYGCIYAENLKVPASVQSIGDNAFALCSKLGRMDVDALLPPTVEDKTFYEVSTEAPVYVPDESVDTYKSHAVWGRLNIIGKSQAPMAIDNLQSDQVQSSKVFRNGQIFILRGEKTYTLTGQEVK